MLDFKLGFLNTENLDSSAFSSAFEKMSDDRKKETLALVSENRRKQKIAADMLCRQMLANADGINPENIIFGKASNGKPYARNSDFRFSISHCGNLVICAVSKKEIGIDIEKIRDIRLKAAEKFASKNELEYIGNDLERFFEICRKRYSNSLVLAAAVGRSLGSVSQAHHCV
jgi:4'-phosphopantetheinyl transferase